MHQDLAEILNVNLIHSHIEDNSIQRITFIRKKIGQTGRPSIQSHICSHKHTYQWRPQSWDRRAGITKHHSQSNIWPCYLEINPCVKYVCALTRYMHERETQMTSTMFYSLTVTYYSTGMTASWLNPVTHMPPLLTPWGSHGKSWLFILQYIQSGSKNTRKESNSWILCTKSRGQRGGMCVTGFNHVTTHATSLDSLFILQFI